MKMIKFSFFSQNTCWKCIITLPWVSIIQIWSISFMCIGICCVVNNFSKYQKIQKKNYSLKFWSFRQIKVWVKIHTERTKICSNFKYQGKSLRRNLLSFLQGFLNKDFHYFQNTLTSSLIICWNNIILLHFSKVFYIFYKL